MWNIKCLLNVRYISEQIIITNIYFVIVFAFYTQTDQELDNFLSEFLLL